MFNFCFERGWVGNSAPSGDQSLSPSWLHARHSYNSHCVNPEELYLFHFIIAPVAAGRSLILLLLEGCIIPGFSTCVPQLQGGITGETDAGSDKPSGSVCLNLSLSIRLACLYFFSGCLICLLTKWSLYTLTRLSSCLTAHFHRTVRGHGSFISVAFCGYGAPAYKSPL